MPTYQYRCTECGHELEAVQKFTDDPLTICPDCDGKLRKIFNAVGVVFKGSGFYKTDSRSTDKSGSGSTTSGSTSDSKSSDSSSTSTTSDSSQSVSSSSSTSTASTAS